MARLRRIDGWPDGLEALDARQARRVFPEPTLLAIPGRRPEPLFVSVLLHGNETTGFDVLVELARRFRGETPPRALMVFVGNVAAAEEGARYLPGQPDFNRIWAGGDTSEHAMAAEVVAAARAAKPFASIDVHNNTGRNPLYGCIHEITPANLSLAALFSRVGVLYDNPKTTQSIAFTPLCPAITLECGRPGVAANVERASQYVLDVLHLAEIDESPAASEDLTLFRTVGRLVVDPDAEFVFGDGDAVGDALGVWDLHLPADLDLNNFSELPAGFPFARAGADRAPIKVLDENLADLTETFLAREGEVIRLARSVTPAMLTTDPDIVRLDCLGYFMERVGSSVSAT